MPNILSVLISALRYIGLAKSQIDSQTRLSKLYPNSEKHHFSQPTLHPVLLEFQAIIEGDPDLYMAFHQMFEQIPSKHPYNIDATGSHSPQIRHYRDMLEAINSIFNRAPKFGDGTNKVLPPVPLGALLCWPMNTNAGRRVFTNYKVNSQMKKILDIWAQFLSSPKSRYVLTTDDEGWFGPEASTLLPNFVETYECNPEKEYYGFNSWDDFFTRRFRHGVRPVIHPDDPSIILSACESVAYKVSTNIQEFDSFWIKGEPYSLSHMLDQDPLSTQFVGGTLYQAYLSAYNYHRWHSPINGTIVKVVHVPGTYFAISPATSFENGNPDPKPPIQAQAFTVHVATRLLIFIESDNPEIGLMCLVMVGMVEVSSCELTVKVGDRVKKGDQLGMFHYGGSTYCMVFRPQTKVTFMKTVHQSLEDHESIMLLNTPVACVENHKIG